MDSALTEIISQWGAFGLIISCALYIIYDYIKSGRKGNEDRGITEEKVIKIIDERINDLNIDIDDKLEKIEDKIVDISDVIINKIQNINNQKEHMGIQDIVKIGPKLHNILGKYKSKIQVDHIFIGSFHNGSSTITGIPYYKFDIIVERFNPEDNIQDTEFAPKYKNMDLLQYDKLPIALFNKEILYYSIDDDYNSDIQKMSEIVYHKMIARGVKQLVAIILRDENEVPNGFVCGINYMKKQISFADLKDCRFELERVYKESKIK